MIVVSHGAELVPRTGAVARVEPGPGDRRVVVLDDGAWLDLADREWVEVEAAAYEF